MSGTSDPRPQTPDPTTPLVLFATHYHELTELSETLGGAVKNLHVAVEEFGDEIVFLHRVDPGAAGASYGIHVARLAGLPAPVVSRAQGLLRSLSVSQEKALTGERAKRAAAAAQAAPDQMMLFTQFVPHPVVEELKAIDLARLSPMDAFDQLRRMQAAAVNGDG